MSSRTIITQPGQCMEDIALQEYGSIDGVTNLFLDNEDVFTDGYSTDLAAGTELVIGGDPIDQAMYDTMRKLGITPATNATVDSPPPPLNGDFNNDYNDDFLIS